MVKKTEFKTTLGGSIGAGMKSVFGGVGRKYFILEHKISSLYHKAGESQKIIVDEIELGRDPKCAVRFDDSFETVSRRHAAIVKDGDNWKLVQLSKTNSTYLNGHKVESEWFLQSGDEIQLSTNGPKLGFIVPQGDQASVKSIGLTARLSLFRQQALRPYKTALSVLSSVLVLVVAGSVWFGLRTTTILDEYKGTIADDQQTIAELQSKILEDKNAIQILEDEFAASKRYYNKVMKEFDRLADSIEHLKIESNNSGDLSVCHPYTYFIKMYKITVDGETVLESDNWMTCGTGFMLDDGRFVTARHVSNSLLYSNAYFFDERGQLVFYDGIPDLNSCMELRLNCLKSLDHDVTCHFRAISTTNTIEFTDKDFIEDDSADMLYMLSEDLVYYDYESGQEEVMLPAGAPILVGGSGSKDWAYFVPSGASGGNGLKKDVDKSVNLVQGEDLYILGYPHGRGEGNPIMSKAVASQNGLNSEDGTIMTSNTNTEGGNSGGPVFVKQGDEYSVVGIVSGRTYEKGRMVPIKMIYQ